MPKLTAISGEKLVKLLVKSGFVFISQKGSHVKLRRDRIMVVIPNHKEIRKGTLSNILKLTSLDLEK